MVARALVRLGVRCMYGVIGIPVTELASAAQVRLAAPCACMMLCRFSVSVLHSVG